MWYGWRLSNWGRPEEGLEVYQRGLEIDPLHPTLNVKAGTLLMEFGRWDEAARALEKATEIDPTHAFGFGVQGFLAYFDGRLDEAVILARKAVELDPENPEYQGVLTWWYLELGAAQANEALEGATATAPNDWARYTTLLLHFLRQEEESMLEAAREVLRSDPRDTLALRVLAEADIEAGRHAQALQRYREGLPELFEDPPKIANADGGILEEAVDLAALMIAMNDEESAHRLLDRSLEALRADPRPVSVLRVFNPMGEPALYALRGDKKAALAALRRAIDRGPLVDGNVYDTIPVAVLLVTAQAGA